MIDKLLSTCAGRSLSATNDDCSEQFAFDYLSDNSALLTVTHRGKQAQVTISATAMRSLRDSLNARYQS